MLRFVEGLGLLLLRPAGAGSGSYSSKPRSLQRNATRGASARHAGLALRQHQCSCCGRALAVRRSALSLGFALEAARLDPKGRGAARRGGCFNPPQYRPETNLLGFRVLIWTPAGRMIREALDRAKTTSPQRKRLKFASLFCDGLSFARGGHVAWPIHTTS